MRKVRSTLMVLLLVLTTAVAVVSILLTLFLPTVLQRLACAPYGIRCAIGQAMLHPHLNLTIDLVVDRPTVFEGDGRSAVLQARRLAVTLDLRALILSRRLMPTGVTIDSPDLLLRKLDDGRWNVMALVQEVRRHLRPTARATPLQVPWVSLNAGAFRLGDRRITDLNVRVEPRPAPLLLELQARAQVEGQPVQATAVVTDILQGEVRVKGLEVMLSGSARPWTPRAALRYRIDPAAHAVHIPAWTLEDDGVTARGAGIIRYGDWPPAYALTVAGWRADLSLLGPKLPLPRLFSWKGQIKGEPITLEGRWPHRPAVSIGATVSDVSLHLRTQQVGLQGLKGSCRLQHADHRLQLQVELRGEAADVRSQRLPKPMVNTTLSADLITGDVTVEEIRASISGMQFRAKGTGKRWGRDGLDVTTTELTVEPGVLNRLLQRAQGGLTIKAIQHPSLHVRWAGEGRPWTAEMTSRSLQLASPTWRDAIAMQGVEVTLQGIGTSWSELQGTVASRQADIAGHRLMNPMAKIEIHSDRVHVPSFRVVAAGGNIEGGASFARPSPLSDVRAALSVRGLRVREFLPATTQPGGWPDVALDADISGTLSQGQVEAKIDLPPTVTRQLSRLLRPADQTASGQAAADGHLLLLIRGALQGPTDMQASGSVRVQGLRALLAEGNSAAGDAPVDVSVGYRDGLLTLKTHDLALTAHELTPLLKRPGGGRIHGSGGGVVISADATLGTTRPLSAGGTIVIHGLSLDLPRENAPPLPLPRELTGSLTFTLDKERLAIKETTLRAAGGVHLVIGGSLSLGQTGDASRFHLRVPWTEASSFLPPLAALAKGRIDDTRLTGQVQADLELVGQEYHATVALRGITMESKLLRLDGVSGSIPLAGKIGTVSIPDHASNTDGIVWAQLSETEYHAALERSRKKPSSNQSPHSLVIASLRYGSIEIRHFEASLAPAAGDRIAIERFVFEAWGGRATGHGTIHPSSGNVTLVLLVDGLSLRTICDAFPPITGYISGMINGLVALSIQGLALDKAEGKARFWAVDSREEQKQISRILIEKLAGQRIRYFNLFGQDRRYDRAVLDVALKGGNLIFHELDISHTTLGIKDLDVKASSTFNKIGFAHLFESIRKATERIKAKAQPNP